MQLLRRGRGILLSFLCRLIIAISFAHIDYGVAADYFDGHLKPLGSHFEPFRNLTRMKILSEPATFYGNHVKDGQPVVFRDVAVTVPVFNVWNDDYLTKNYGDLEVTVETTKKENRSKRSRQMMLREFIQKYKSDDLYLVHHITGKMKDEISLPKPLQCGGLQKMIVEAVLWLSSGGTKSALHNDEFNNFNCLLEGRKEIILIDRKYKSQVEAHGFVQEGHYSLVDVDMVDMNMFPGLRELPYYAVTLHPGDCIFMPARWYHQVRSFGSRNMAYNIWFAQLLKFDSEDCDNAGALPEFTSLKDYNFTGHIEQMRANLFEEFVSLQVVTLEDCQRLWGSRVEDNYDIEKLFNLIDKNSDEELSWRELYTFDVLDVARRFPLLFVPKESGDVTPISNPPIIEDNQQSGKAHEEL